MAAKLILVVCFAALAQFYLPATAMLSYPGQQTTPKNDDVGYGRVDAKELKLRINSSVCNRVQAALGQYVGRAGFGGCGCGGRGLGYGGYGLGNDIGIASGLGASHGGGLPVVTASGPVTGLGVSSENVYEGTVGVCGNLPFLGSAAVEGVFPTAGAGGINYGCGDGAVGIVAEERLGGIGYGGYGLGYGAGYGLGYGGIAGRGCGCGCGAGIY